MKNIKFNPVSFILILLVFYSAILSLVWQQLFRQISEDRKQTVATAIIHHNNLVFALEQNTVRTIQEADVVLRLTKNEIERMGADLSLERYINKGIGRLPVFNGLAVIGTNGNQINAYPGVLKFQTINFSSRDYFTIHKKYPDTLFISKPQLSSSLKKPVIVISRRINGKFGHFAGTVALQILPSAFMAFYKEASLNEFDILSLISPEGITYSRRTGDIESSGENIRKSPLFEHLKQSSIGNYFAHDAIRNIPTYFSYRKLNAYPIIATVGSSETDILVNFQKRKRKAVAFGAIVTVFLFVFCVYIVVTFLQRRKAIKLLVSNEARYRSIFNGCQDAIFLLSPCGKVEAVNPAARKLFSIKSSYDNLYFIQLYVTRTPFANFYDQLSKNKEFQFERLDRSTFHAEISSSSFFDADGKKHLLLLIRDVSARKRMEKRLANEKKRHQLELTKHIITVQEQEREVIGRELHDNINQILTSVKLFLETALVSDEKKDELICRSMHHVSQSIKEIRALSHSLSAPTLGTGSLLDSVKVLAEDIKANSSFNITVDCRNFHQPVSKEQGLALYRIVQEQVNNIIKHSNGSEIIILLWQTTASTLLSVQDNGRGFSLKRCGKGIGISNMESRAKAFGGTFLIEEASCGGCKIEVALPLELELSRESS